MSDPHDHSVEPTLPAIPAPADLSPPGKVPTVAISLVLAGALTVFTAGVLWADSSRHQKTELLWDEHGAADEPSEINDEELGIIDRGLFETQRKGQDDREKKTRQLNSYGWVKGKKDVIHIPIDRAMEQVLAEQKP